LLGILVLHTLQFHHQTVLELFDLYKLEKIQ
jgi:hypothetical protein